jgi:para-nitrobenzyl esterase
VEGAAAVKPWIAYRNANRFGPICEQISVAPGSLFFKGDAETRSEDCLYLNLWTPAKTTSDKRPVMVWIYGGSFTHGSGTEAFYDGEFFARKGVILVTFNYRVGALGFLAHPELSRESGRGVSGNYGLLDQLAALEWVHRNIAAFGRDPANVTIFGQSAGAASVEYLLVSPLAKGLFQRAIGESGLGAGDCVPLATVETHGVAFAQALGATSLSELRALPAQKVMAARGAFNRAIDGYYLPDDPFRILAAGKQNPADVIIGSVANEGYAAKPISVAAFQEMVKKTYGNMAGEFLKAFPVNSDQEADHAQFVAASDRLQAICRTWASLENKTGNRKSYLYFFSHSPAFPKDVVYPEGPGDRLGAFHSSEVQYVFGTLQTRVDWPWTEYDHKLSDAMSTYWSNFAATGDPNGKGLPVWPNYDDVRQREMIFGDQITAQPIGDRKGVDFMAAFTEKQRTAK